MQYITVQQLYSRALSYRIRSLEWTEIQSTELLFFHRWFEFNSVRSPPATRNPQYTFIGESFISTSLHSTLLLTPLLTVRNSLTHCISLRKHGLCCIGSYITNPFHSFVRTALNQQHTYMIQQSAKYKTLLFSYRLY